MTPHHVPRIVHVAVCHGCGTPLLVARTASNALATGCLVDGCLPGNAAITVEMFRYVPKKKRSSRKPRKAWKR